MKIKIGNRFRGSVPNILDAVLNIALAYNSYRKEFKSGMRCLAFAFDGSKLINYGENKYKTHTFTKKYHDNLKNTIHAEADLVMKLIKYNKTNIITDIIVIRGALRPLDSIPCIFCRELIDTYFNHVRVWSYNSKINKWRYTTLGRTN